MKHLSKKIYLIILTCFFISSLLGQKGVEDGSKYGHGEDSIRCIKNLSLYREYARQDDYVSAYPFWKIVFDECPRSSKNIYIDGVKIYRYFIDETDNTKRGSDLTDTLMLIYDRRLKYYNEIANVRGRQGVDLLRYRRNEDIQYIKQAYDYLEESIEAGGNNSSNPVLATFVSASITLYQNEEIDENRVIEDYITAFNIIQNKMKIRPKNARLKSLMTSIDNNFINEGPAQCSTLERYFSVELKDKPENAGFLRMLTSLLQKRDCSDSELFFDASKKLHTMEPSAQSAVNIASMAFNNGLFSEAADYYTQALQLETDSTKKAEWYYGMAACYRERGRKSEARSYALQSIKLNPDWGEPYLLIGQLYADSKSDCNSLSLPNAVFWAAVDKFDKARQADPSIEAKANKLILTYSNYFPNKEEAFFQDVYPGNTYTVGCWINEKTLARFND